MFFVLLKLEVRTKSIKILFASLNNKYGKIITAENNLLSFSLRMFALNILSTN